MKAINDAFEGANAFSSLLRTIKGARQPTSKAADPEVRAWNERIDRERAERKARKAAKARA